MHYTTLHTTLTFATLHFTTLHTAVHFIATLHFSASLHCTMLHYATLLYTSTCSHDTALQRPSLCGSIRVTVNVNVNLASLGSISTWEMDDQIQRRHATLHFTALLRQHGAGFPGHTLMTHNSGSEAARLLLLLPRNLKTLLSPMAIRVRLHDMDSKLTATWLGTKSC